VSKSRTRSAGHSTNLKKLKVGNVAPTISGHASNGVTVPTHLFILRRRRVAHLCEIKNLVILSSIIIFSDPKGAGR
jgi:hypothetical protein